MNTPRLPVSALAHHVGRVIRMASLLRPGDRIIIGVSGGPDSVALLALLAELRASFGWRMWAVYVRHGWRPGADRRAVACVRQVGAALGVPLRVVVISPRKRPRHSWEGTARMARYAALLRVARRVRATAIAVGHTEEDQAETVLLALLRGTGLRGAGGMPATRPEQAPKRYARWMEQLREAPRWRPYPSYAALADRLQKNNPRLTRERAEFLARHWGKDADGGGVVLRSDPAHKLINATLYRLEEARACWERATAPVLWVDAAESETLKRMKLSAAEHAERRGAFKSLQYRTVKEAGHMLHHDQPEEVARLIEEFLV